MPTLPSIISTQVFIAIACTMARGDGLKVDVLCNTENFDVDPFYPFTVAFLDQVVACTLNSENSTCSIDETYKEGSLWGHGECLQDHGKDVMNCEECTGMAKVRLYKRCDARAKGAQIRFPFCSLRYETYKFMADPLS